MPKPLNIWKNILIILAFMCVQSVYGDQADLLTQSILNQTNDDIIKTRVKKNVADEMLLARIKQISTTGKYVQKDQYIQKQRMEILDVLQEKPTSPSQIQPTASIAKKSSQSKKPVLKISEKNKKFRYCSGGSYKALAKRAKKYDKSVLKYSKKYGVSENLIKAVITAESCFNEKALSPKGAQGLMQLMPPTAKRFGVSDSFNPDSNIKGGVRYLKFLLKYFKEDLLNVIAAYNAGEGAVDKYKGVPPYKETKHYVRKVAALYKLYSVGHGVLTAVSVKNSTFSGLENSVFVPRAMPRSRFSPYKDRRLNISHGQCANRTSTRLRKTTIVENGQGIWQRIYKVQRGDTLMRVMQKTGVHKYKIAQMNGLRSRARLKKGQELLVWECRK